MTSTLHTEDVLYIRYCIGSNGLEKEVEFALSSHGWCVDFVLGMVGNLWFYQQSMQSPLCILTHK